MVVTPLGPRETIEWFEQLDRQHEILCFMITANPEHRRILRELAQNFVDADVALGRKVAFIVFGGGDGRSYAEVEFRSGTRTFLPGEPLQPRGLRHYARNGYFGKDMERGEMPMYGDLEPWQVEHLTTETVSVAAEWMQLTGVQRESLPVLCSFVKGSDPIVIGLGENLDVSKILKLFGRLADIAERSDQNRFDDLTFGASQRMKRAIDATAEISRHEKSLCEHMDAMCNRFKATSEERLLAADFLSRQTYTRDALERFLATLSFSSSGNFSSNTTVRGLRNKLDKLSAAIDLLEECRPNENLVASVSEALEAIKSRRQETARLVSELATQGVDARSLDKQALGLTYDRYVARVNQAATLLEKLGKFVGAATGAKLIAHILR